MEINKGRNYWLMTRMLEAGIADHALARPASHPRLFHQAKLLAATEVRQFACNYLSADTRHILSSAVSTLPVRVCICCSTYPCDASVVHDATHKSDKLAAMARIAVGQGVQNRLRLGPGYEAAPPFMPAQLCIGASPFR